MIWPSGSCYLLISTAWERAFPRSVPRHWAPSRVSAARGIHRTAIFTPVLLHLYSVSEVRWNTGARTGGPEVSAQVCVSPSPNTPKPVRTEPPALRPPAPGPGQPPPTGPWPGSQDPPQGHPRCSAALHSWRGLRHGVGDSRRS